MKKTKKISIGKIAAAVLLLVFVIGPLTLYALLVLGWPPVTGNLTAAHAMRSYAGQIHPEWTAEGGWAGYNLVDGGYYLGFTAGGGKPFPAL